MYVIAVYSSLFVTTYTKDKLKISCYLFKVTLFQKKRKKKWKILDSLKQLIAFGGEEVEFVRVNGTTCAICNTNPVCSISFILSLFLTASSLWGPHYITLHCPALPYFFVCILFFFFHNCTFFIIFLAIRKNIYIQFAVSASPTASLYIL